MANKYLVWKDAACKGQNIEWLEMNGRDFFRFLNSTDSNGRRFIMLDNHFYCEADVIFIEATEEVYQDWYKDYCHHCYLIKTLPKTGILSLDMSLNDEEMSSLYDLISDVNADVAESAVRTALLNMLPYAISTLNTIRKEAVMLKYFKYPDKPDREIAKILGIEEKAFVKRKDRAISDLRKFFKK